MSYSDEQIRERLQRLLHREGLTQYELAKRIGRQPTNMSSILSGKRAIPKSLPMQLVKAIPKLRIDWILFGVGNMYEDEDEDSREQPQNTRPRLPKSMSNEHLEEYYAGKLRGKCQEKPIVTQFSDYDFSLILKNNRMTPKYDRGDELFFKRSTIIEWGNDYLIDTTEGPKFKRIVDEGDKVRCRSHNEAEYPDFFVDKDLIRGYYRCVGVLRIL